ncbi:hypothetical protein NECAME_14867 [Necator americanus]|uniref:Uncharacterized protein n=1 Tax=Necator americanus TaxID=51031 RepID=W2SLB3_NECAM|nr:hypothetical protein NECAME_14867 [Necator americanus]ETN70313.1 hypothetical protein NECAME_14867 [Necator americanus]
MNLDLVNHIREGTSASSALCRIGNAKTVFQVLCRPCQELLPRTKIEVGFVSVLHRYEIIARVSHIAQTFGNRLRITNVGCVPLTHRINKTLSEFGEKESEKFAYDFSTSSAYRLQRLYTHCLIDDHVQHIKSEKVVRPCALPASSYRFLRPHDVPRTEHLAKKYYR